MTRAKFLAYGFALLALIGAPLVAAERAPAAAETVRTSPEQASGFVDTLGKRAVALLQGYNDADAAKHQAEFKQLVREGFDLDLIGRFVLGNSWRTATPQQQSEYLGLFSTWVLDSYSRRLGAYKGETFKIIGSKPMAATDAVVETEIDRPNGAPIKAAWRVRSINGQLKIIDVYAEGVSMALTQRQEFASVIQHDGLDGLIRDLRTRVQNLQAKGGES